MNWIKMALIGESGAGKTESVRRLGGILAVADMDPHFEAGVVPEYPKVMDWILNRTPGEKVLAISPHFRTFQLMTEARKRGECVEQFRKILFVHLWNPDPEQREERLRKTRRTASEIKNILEYHRIFYDACQGLADVTVKTDRLGIEEQVRILKALRDGLIRGPS